MYEVRQTGPMQFEIVDRGAERTVATTKRRSFADNIALVLNRDAERARGAENASADFARRFPTLAANIRKDDDSLSGFPTESPVLAADAIARLREREVGEEIIRACRGLGFAAEWSDAPTGSLEVPMPGGYTLIVGTASSKGWGWAMMDAGGNDDSPRSGPDGGEIPGAELAASSAEQAGFVVREVRRQHARRVAATVRADVCEIIASGLVLAFPGAVTGDVPAGVVFTLEEAAEAFARAWIMANVPGAPDTIR